MVVDKVVDKAFSWIPGLTNRKELAFLFNDVMDVIKNSKHCVRILEIGTWYGRSAYVLASAINIVTVITEDCKLFCLDNWSKDNVDAKFMRENFDEKVRKSFPELITILMEGSTNDYVDNFRENYFDFIFIDGDHSYEAVINDLIKWYPKLRNGGHIIGHDFRRTQPDRVMKAVCEFFGKGNFTWIKKGTSFFKHIKGVQKCHWLESKGKTK